MSGRFPILWLAEADPEEAVLSSGVLAHLVETIGHAGFTIVGSPQSAPLFADTPRLDRLIVLEKEGALDWIGLWNRLRRTRWGLVVDMRRTGLATKLTRQKRAERGEDAPGLHAVEAAAAVLKLDEIPAPKLFVGEETQAVADALIKPDDRPILAVGPGVEWMGKRWPAERFAKVATPLLADDGPLAGGRLMIVGEEIERDAAHTIRFAVPRARVIELQGKLTPLQTAAALRHAKLYVGNDSLWTQLAVAAGVPSVAVFGPSDEAMRGPWRGASVRGPRSLEEFKALDPRLNQAIQHMMDLPYERVLKAARKLLAERSTP
ncbi:MAG: glycosyltransferase family 9 protein [Brevundimonas sp.]|uniref:glycosyltransferase family 9 protein n=1 Tax=Brevundimonas sp. TaxID=1871086 RepID=UPI0025BE1014|nr:glycosyltransferase family 9 protein [Brevundimonas sp.]MBX3477743.1 glycosyltransferase family 9 protein [Brevundimonas sp.]